jgi:hypothetical protein
VRCFHTKEAAAAVCEDDASERSGLGANGHHDRQVLDPHPLIVKIGNTSEAYIPYK